MKVPALSLAANVEITDEQIVDRVLHGEKEIYEVLIRRHNLKLYRVARGILKEDAEVEDVMQEAYLKAFEKLSQFKGKARFSTWLTRILINSALARFKERKRFLDMDQVKEIPDLNPQEMPFESNDEQMQENIKRALESAIDALPPKYRSVFMLRELERMSVADTAFCLDISEENVKVRLHRAKEMLKSVIRKTFVDVDLFGFRGHRCDMLTTRVMEKVLH